ncbi:MAG TPA: serine/threonine-protein kinase [Solirubrobacterales bacterium]|jgi:serine/threonine protein kinase
MRSHSARRREQGPAKGAQRAPSWDFAEGDDIVPGLSALRRLGGGNRFDAYLAWDDHRRSVVVAKLIRPHLVEDEWALAALEAEWGLIETLSHPVIVRGFSAELDGPRPHLVLEYLRGPRLSTLLRRFGPLPVEQLVPLAVRLAAALHYLHAEGVVHLDVKAANTIMGAPPRLIDLSVARDLEEAAELSRPVGTAAYMAPEQCLPRKLGPVGPAADVWGLGVTLYEAATGERPFPRGDASGEREVRWPQLARDPDPLAGRLPAALAEPIMACLQRDPAARPSPAELAETFEEVLARLPKPTPLAPQAAGARRAPLSTQGPRLRHSDGRGGRIRDFD